MQDAKEYEFLTLPRAELDCRLVATSEGLELQFFGNRAGILSLSNGLLWLHANAWRREFFSLGELPFVHLEGRLSVCIRQSGGAKSDGHGSICRMDQGESLEWELTEGELTQVGLCLHRLASSPEHEYDRLLLADGSACCVHVRMTDAAEWIR